ncbi:hypothetical protein HWV62_37061 [Athelia sp. TMB]|nr:hypothetical protein HWV62_37061 [Athelia sp. TMB]
MPTRSTIWWFQLLLLQLAMPLPIRSYLAFGTPSLMIAFPRTPVVRNGRRASTSTSGFRREESRRGRPLSLARKMEDVPATVLADVEEDSEFQSTARSGPAARSCGAKPKLGSGVDVAEAQGTANVRRRLTLADEGRGMVLAEFGLGVARAAQLSSNEIFEGTTEPGAATADVEEDPEHDAQWGRRELEFGADVAGGKAQ